MVVANETGANFGGNLFVDSLSDDSGPASSYIKMLEHNLDLIKKGLFWIMDSINYQNFRIEAENICVDYNGKVALYDANLRLKPGQICGLVGMNGAGNTTFFNALTGFVNISKG